MNVVAYGVTAHRTTAHRTTAAAIFAAIVAVTVSSCASESNLGSMPVPKASHTMDRPATGCPAPGVAIWVGDVDAATGLRALTISMTNCGDGPYKVNGYPMVWVLDGNRKLLDVQVRFGTRVVTADPAFATNPKPVTLAPGDTATAVVVWRNLVTDPAAVATTGVYLDVAPVPGAPSQTLTPKGGVDLGNTGLLGVGPWKAGASK